MLKKINNQRGDTIIEVLLAISILALVLASTYGLSTRASRLAISSRERTQAVALVNAQAEIARTMSRNEWNQVSSWVANNSSNAKGYFSTNGNNNWVINSGQIELANYGADFKIWFNASLYDDSGSQTNVQTQATLIQYRVSAEWLDINGTENQTTTVVVKVNKP